jgi:mono/diheme cytochrome c family protein
MTTRESHLPLLHSVFLAMSFCTLGCGHISGRPGPGPQVARPEQVLDFATLYKTNCAGCHGANGNHGAAISLSNPVYLAVAGEDTLKDITAKGVHGKLMPAFAKSAGGSLTDQQVSVLARGMIQLWGKSDLLTTQNPPPYRATLSGDVAHGQQQFGVSCASCHGANGEGNSKKSEGGDTRIGSIVDASYLALVSDQAIRSFVIAGLPDQEMPDWRSDATTPLTDQQITDIVAWLTSKRTANPGQPYPVRP